MTHGGTARGTARWTAAAVRDMDPASFAFVMATGIVSDGTFEQGPVWLSRTLLGVAVTGLVVLGAALVARLVWYRAYVIADLRAPARSFGFFAIVAALNVLAVRLTEAGHRGPAAVLAALAAAGWLTLTYAVPADMLMARERESALADVDGEWLLWVVATQSVSVMAAVLAPVWRAQAGLLALVAAALWCIGLVLYLLLVAAILLRWLTASVTPEALAPPYWILMGATAISVLAGAHILSLPASLAAVRVTAPMVTGFSFALWAFGTWWVPLLLVLAVWHHTRRGARLRYEPTLWSAVFPLGMDSVATRAFGGVTRLGPVAALSRWMLWVSVAAWLLVAAAGCAAWLGRARPRPGTGAPGPPSQ